MDLPLDTKSFLARTVFSAVLTASTVALGGYFVAVPIMKEQIANFQKELLGVKADVESLRGEVRHNYDRLDDKIERVRNGVR